jgi:rfaE bifunctional protein nucleotidyltransferase chain/domain/rfaE bifunctional protein kinase chain/domain
VSARPITVVGDCLLDRDVVGRVERICPDAPAPVFEESQAVDRPGGAALTAALLADAGRPVRLVTAVGDDPAGRRLRDLLADAGVELVALPYLGETPEKVRLCAGHQVLMRMDRGVPGRLGQPAAEVLAAALAGAGAVVVSDYGRGVTGLREVRRAVADSARTRPVVWDPHPRGTAPVPGVRLVTPNEAEVRGVAAGDAYGAGDGRRMTSADPIHSGRFAGLARAAGQVREAWQARAVAVTLGADGALLAQGGPTPMVVPAPLRCDGDPCGAGDRFAGAAAAALADGGLVSEAVQAAVADAAAFVAAGAARGYARRRASTGAAERAAEVDVDAALALAAATRGSGGTVVATGGCFDLLHAGHVATLEAARALGDCLIVCLNSDRSVRALKGPDRPLVPQQDRARLVAALGCVDAVAVFEELTPQELLGRLRPDVWVKGGDYFLDDPDDRPVLPEAEQIRGWGGQTVVVPYLADRSTTGLIETARARGRSASGGESR